MDFVRQGLKVGRKAGKQRSGRKWLEARKRKTIAQTQHGSKKSEGENKKAKDQVVLRDRKKNS